VTRSAFLLDTHVLLWWLTDTGDLTRGAAEAIADPSNALYVSTAAGIEIGIKKNEFGRAASRCCRSPLPTASPWRPCRCTTATRSIG